MTEGLPIVAKKKPWPKLSETLHFERRPDLCQACGARAPFVELERWCECDEADTPTTTILMLCSPCADALIEPHPRLYRPLEKAEPFRGAMAPCVDCVHRVGLLCRSPQAKGNGGPGLQYEPAPTRAHVCRRGRGQRSGYVWLGEPIRTCSGFEPVSPQ